MLEIEMYPAIKKYFEELGFLVRSEVRDIDVIAQKEDLLIGIEMKNNLSISLLTQGALRQKTCDLVYLAVPKPTRIVKNKTFKNLMYLLKRLELGLLYIDVTKAEAIEVMEPTFYDLNMGKRQKIKEKNRILKEIKGRSVDGNQGGSHRKKLLTAYREDSLRTVALMEIMTILAPKDLTQFNLNKSLLQNNYYDWFMRVERGKYTLNENIEIDSEFLPYIEIFKKEYEEILRLEEVDHENNENLEEPKEDKSTKTKEMKK